MVSQVNQIGLQNIKQFIKQSHFQEALALCTQIQSQQKTTQDMHQGAYNLTKILPKQHFNQNQFYWELQSLRAYCLANIDRLSQAIQRTQKCIKEMPRHSPSIRRLASFYQKEGSLDQALKFYKLAEIYEPDSHEISQKIIKLQSKLKKNLQNLTNTQKKITSHSLEASTEQNSKLHVTFGHSQVFQMISEDSDEYFAHIKSQLNKLNEVKPKKSILKCSKSLNKINDQKIQISHQSEEEKYQYEQLSNKKALSIKSEKIIIPKKWDEKQQIQKQKSNTKSKSGQKKQNKKKSVYFSFEGESYKNQQQ